ncbi:23S rRNA (pseudouridine1915-N3)-methyltransferase [Spiroplasma corruscae]|uniref:Ribosomal RNA large subunit methyltransferase H n=1 Tax=Spiroplasma corruscae TaxID=216934 RepID=A0A222EQJ6_9MOLU|nr:23S rRNA (pseudouridine(1915)-N(3))-methyltransferase RlmH [Spiroplasma corruscae]ASP28533.1 23S rRNA (pseudouridine1915-N3)-methyltransferase [Spiroplasma corruscae]
MSIKIVCFNKVSNEYRDLNEFYINKINKFINIELIEIKEINYGNPKEYMAKNEYNINERLNKFKNYDTYLLEINSTQIDSTKFSKIINNCIDTNSGNICFIIGPSDGYSESFKSKFKNQISFGKITFPHQLVRIILLEQIYRSFKIIKNQKYHK